MGHKGGMKTFQRLLSICQPSLGVAEQQGWDLAEQQGNSSLVLSSLCTKLAGVHQPVSWL